MSAVSRSGCCQLVGWRQFDPNSQKRETMSSSCHVISVECQKCQTKSRSDKTLVFHLLVHWSDYTNVNIQRPYTSLFDFMLKLKELYPGSQIPPLKDAKWFEPGPLRGWRDDKKKKAIDEFFQKLLSLPENIVRGKDVREFFEFQWSENGTTGNNNEPDSDAGKNQPIVQLENEYESFDQDSCGYSTLSIKPKTVPVFKDQAESDDSNSIYWAVVEYSKRRSGEVTLKEGATVNVLQRELSGWWFVHVKETDEQGWAPATSLLPADRNNLDECIVTGSFGQYQAIRDVEATEPDELSCRKGDIVEVIEASLCGWWKVRCKDKVGTIAAANVEPVSNTTQSSSRISIYQSSDLYKKCSPPPRRNNNVTVDELYARVDKFHRDVSTNPKKPVSSISDDAGEYAEVELNRTLTFVCNKNSVTPEPTDDFGNFYMNSSPTLGRHPYVNVQAKAAVNQEIKYYRAIAKHAPIVKHQGQPQLMVEAGDIIEAHIEQQDKVFGKVHLLASSNSHPDPKEGWISKSLLEPYKLGQNEIKSTNPKMSQLSKSDDHGKSLTGQSLKMKQFDAASQRNIQETRPKLFLPESKPLPAKPPSQEMKSKSPLSKDPPRPQQKASSIINAPDGENGIPIYSALCKQNTSNQKDPELFTIRKLSRIECEKLLLNSRSQNQFIIRESTKAGCYALSVHSRGRILHFPIELTPEGKYFIGKYNFDSLAAVISYYKQNSLFELEDGAGITLGSSMETI